MTEENDLAGRRLLVVTEEELQRIVLDVHDGPVQYLFAALSQLAAARARLPEQTDAECTDALERAARLLERTLSEVRSTLSTFRAPAFTERRLADIVEELAVEHETLAGAPVALTVVEPLPEVSALVKIALFRVLQEALSNIRRHAGVSGASVRLAADDGELSLDVLDHGRGFVPPPLVGPGATEQQAHIGLRGMRERVAMVRGSLRVESRPGAGTLVLVRVPADAWADA